MDLQKVKDLLGDNYNKFVDLSQKFGQSIDEDWSDRKYKAVNKELSKLLAVIKEILIKEEDEDGEADQILDGLTFLFASQRTHIHLQDLASAIDMKGKGV